MYIVKVCKAVIHIVDFNLSGFYRKQELLFFSGIKRKINSHYCDKGVKHIVTDIRYLMRKTYAIT